MRRIIAVDDEEMGRKSLVSAISKADPDAEVIGFSDPKEALAYAKSNDIFAAFLDIQMPGMLGTELGKKIKLAKPNVYIIFATGYDSYMGDAFSLHASGYILKPITAKKVKGELDNLVNLRQSVEKNIQDEGKRVRFQCFGNFEAFVDGVPISFKYDKTKEILAYMVSRRGALCSNSEIATNIWDDDSNHESYFRGLKKDMMDILKSHKLDDIILMQKGKTGVDAAKVSCDYYDFLEGKPGAINLYRGEFMSQYSWGEIMNAELDFQRYE